MQIIQPLVRGYDCLRDNLAFLHASVAHQIVDALDDSVTCLRLSDAVTACKQQAARRAS